MPATRYMPKLHPACISCLMKKHMDRYPQGADPALVMRYMRRLCALMADLPEYTCGAEIVERVTHLRREIFGADACALETDYASVKRHFNDLMMAFAAAEDIPARIRASEDPLRLALGLSMTGNYIDFGALERVDEGQLRDLLVRAHEQVHADDPAFAALLKDLAQATTLVFLTDNCGEIVMDKLLIEALRAMYPALGITVLVRGAPVLNDATMEDAVQVGLDRLPGVTVLGNGDHLAGTALGRISFEARAALEHADVILAKGQGNFETLQGCRLNIYYAFLCKCRLFADRFSVPLLTGMLVRERSRSEEV